MQILENFRGKFLRYSIAILLIILWITPSISEDLSCIRDKMVEKRVNELNSQDFYNPKLDEVILKNPQNSSCVLINNLKTIFLDTSNPKFWNTIASLSLLERLTCTFMKAKSTDKFLGREEEERKSFISVQGSDELIFVGYHMANSRFFVAPRDAQITIINKWHAWYEEKSEGYGFGKCK